MKNRLAVIASVLLAMLAGTGVAAAQQGNAATEPELLIHRLLADNADAMQERARREGVTPVWSSRDGRLMAIVAHAQPAGVPIQPLAPQINGVIDWRLIDINTLLSSGMRWNAGQGLRVDALLSQAPAMPGTQSVLSPPWMASLGLGWGSASGTFDASYGVNWFGSTARPAPYSDWATAPLAVPSMGGLLQLDSGVALSAQTRWLPSADTAINLGASYGRSQFAPIGPAVLPADVEIDQAQLSLGLSKGTISGGLIGHIAHSDDPAYPGAVRRWGGIDLGVSWRTPWQGVLSIGAQNIWSAPLDASPRESPTDSPAVRIPYVQYRQDL